MVHPDFEDDRKAIDNAQGVLAGEGFNQFEKVEEKMTPGHGGPSPGWTFTIHCVNCANQIGIEIGWPELIELSAGAIPTDRDNGQRWTYKDRQASPPCTCAFCGKPVFIYMTPDQAGRYVSAGIGAGVLDRDRTMQMVVQVRQSVAAYQQQRR